MILWDIFSSTHLYIIWIEYTRVGQEILAKTMIKCLTHDINWVNFMLFMLINIHAHVGQYLIPPQRQCYPLKTPHPYSSTEHKLTTVWWKDLAKFVIIEIHQQHVSSNGIWKQTSQPSISLTSKGNSYMGHGHYHSNLAESPIRCTSLVQTGCFVQELLWVTKWLEICLKLPSLFIK